MDNPNTFTRRWSPHFLAILRWVAMFNFISHGTQKVLGYPPTVPPFQWPQLLQAAGTIEIIGGTLIVLGLFTRPVAFILCGEMAFAYFRTHAPRNFWPMINGGEITVLYCFLFLYLITAGPGAWALDNLRHRKERPIVSSNS